MTPANLTPAQAEIVRLVARGYGNGEIAAMLGLPVETLRSHLRVIHPLLGTQPDDRHGDIMSRVRMVIWAYENGLVVPGLKNAEAPR